ncbi:helix-turn-helix domain-containing protein, partial [Deltaproteobacteria bacterium OttesenSCG-928-K17]|nr:helix-turn-helix domain-containing protein [Deltaproteobacteria bacterium OttesenSCG-928-K17]
MDQKLSFIKACVDGSQSLSSLCRDYGISRKTGYKWLNRYNEIGLAGLRDGRSLRLERGSRFDDEIWGHILSLKKDQPTWGPEKVHHWLKRHLSGVDIPSSGTIKAYFLRHGLSGKRKCWISRQSPTEALAAVAAPGDTWCIDFKGWYRSRDGRSCQPLTLTDAYSRFLLLCRQSPHSRFEDIQPLLVKAFEEYGCPLRIR